MAICSARPINLNALFVAAILASIAATLLGQSVEALVAHASVPEQRGRAGGWLQAGNLAGNGIGGGAALWLARHTEQAWMTGAVLGACFLACGIGLTLVNEPARTLPTGGVATQVRYVWRDLWGVVRSSRGILARLVLFLPV